MIDFSKFQLSTQDAKELSELKIKMVFQPIYHAQDLEIAAYEALMRPEGKGPLDLIAEYQEKGKLAVLELATCLGAAHEFVRRGYTKKLCINSLPSEVLTEEQAAVYYGNFPEIIGRVIVELLEHHRPDDKSWIAKKNFIDSHGTQTALDDYSTGFNDESAVEYFKPQYVKLDRSLISDIDKNHDKQKNVQHLISKFHHKGIEVVAEGVETKDEFEYLRSMTEVDYLQGYYLAKPE